MKHMYRANYRVSRKKRALIPVVLFVFAFAASAAYFFIKYDVNKSTSIKTGDQTATSYYDAGKNDTKLVIDEKLYSFALPSDWKEVSRSKTPTDLYIEWQSTEKNYEARTLKLHIDTIPKDFGVNKIIPISVVNNRLVPGDLSDNCANFNTEKYQSGPTVQKVIEKIAAKWEQANFTCDIGNHERNVIGTAVVNGDYNLALQNSSGEKHSFFFVYTDHTINPDYQIVNDVLRSFKMK